MDHVDRRALRCFSCHDIVSENDRYWLACGHFFHRTCFTRIASVCPYCLSGVSENDSRAIDNVRRTLLQERCVRAWEGVKALPSRPLCTNLVLAQLGFGVTVLLGGGERRSEQLLETGTCFLGMWSGLFAEALLVGGECAEVTQRSVYITLAIFLWVMPSLLGSNVLTLDSDALFNAQVLSVFGLMMGLICALLERRLG